MRGHKEEGSTTTPFDMAVRNDMDRFQLVCDVIGRVPALGYRAAHVKQAMRDWLVSHRECIRQCGQDMPEILEWAGPGADKPVERL